MRHVERLPSQKLSSPGQVRILSVGKEVLVEVLSSQRHFLQHGAAVEGRRTARSENVLETVKLVPNGLAGTPIGMPVLSMRVVPFIVAKQLT